MLVSFVTPSELDSVTASQLYMCVRDSSHPYKAPDLPKIDSISLNLSLCRTRICSATLPQPLSVPSAPRDAILLTNGWIVNEYSSNQAKKHFLSLEASILHSYCCGWYFEGVPLTKRNEAPGVNATRGKKRVV